MSKTSKGKNTLLPEFNDNKLAIAYYRYSSASQNEASIEQQRELVHRWADAEGYKIVAEYEDRAKTGTNTNRPGFQKMMREINTIRPAYLITWKNDRLARNLKDVLITKELIRAAGCRIHYIEGIDPIDDDPDSFLSEVMLDAIAAHYSKNLAKNIRRGVNYNAQNALANGHKIFGYIIGDDKRYAPDPVTAPIITQMFTDYARGVRAQKIADRLNAAGVRTVRGYAFTSKALNKILSNRAYIGEYKYAGHVIEGGMPQLVDDDTFEKVQRRFASNKRLGAKTQAQLAESADTDADYWLTTRMFCERCGSPMQGVSGTSKTGQKHRYYYCLNQRKKKCTAKPVRKSDVEEIVVRIINWFLDDTEMLASLAVDMADYYRKTHGNDDEVLKSLEMMRRDVETQLGHFVRAISMGVINETTGEAMRALEERKHELNDAIQAERVKAALHEDEASIGAFYQRFAKAKMDDPETRELLFEYFIDKIWIGPTTVSIASRFYDSTELMDHDNFIEARKMGEVLTLSREFNTSPQGGPSGRLVETCPGTGADGREPESYSEACVSTTPTEA